MKKLFVMLAAAGLILTSCGDDDGTTIESSAGMITGGPFEFAVDGLPDMVSGITVNDAEAVGSRSTWVITGADGTILGMPETMEALEGVNFDGAGVGECFIWYARYEGDVEGLAENGDINDVTGNFALSNSIQVSRNALNAGVITGGPFNFTVSDGIADMVSGIAIDNSTAVGVNSTWVITDDQNNILGLPGTLEMVEGNNFDGAGEGVCLIWYMRYGTDMNLEAGMNVSDLVTGTYALSNSLTVNRSLMADMSVNLTGLEDLGDDFVYEGWIIVEGSPVSTGTFTVDANGTPSATSFEVNGADLASATKFVLSIEPAQDSDPAPADTKILAGDFDGNTASLATSTVGTNFEGATGKYIVATPTGTGDPSEEFSGIWFLDNSSGTAVAGLDLPELSAGWKYEGWVVIDGTPVTTGTFTDPAAADEAAPFSGANGGPSFPGEDFLNNAPAGLTFPTDLRGKTAVISIEPYPDNSTAPFTLKPLAGMIPASLSGNPYSIDNNVSGSFPTGSVSR
ncbi:MAG: anti-sigma factor [Ekhidna sp.]